MRIPFDAECLAVVADELRGYVGGKLQGVRQPTETDVYLALYAQGHEAWLLLSGSPEFARAYLTTRRPANPSIPPTFCATLRARLDGARFLEVATVPGERMMTLRFGAGESEYRLIVELMGKHSNVILVDENDRIVTALKSVSRGQSVRPIFGGGRYVPPPVLGKSEGSPFLRKLREAGGGTGPHHPVLSPGNGAYPYSVAPLALPELSRESLSIALEQHYAVAIPEAEANALRSALATSLERVWLARDTAVADLTRAIESGERAGEWQRMGELVLAYGPSAPAGSDELIVWDYDGTERTLRLDPDLSWKENANRLFERAKKAKARLEDVRGSRDRLAEERDRVAGLMERVEAAEDLATLRTLHEEAKARRWLHLASAAGSVKKEDRPYEGHRIRDTIGPGGYVVLYGENAEANDYLTLRVARPNDYWLHVRGGTSAHVVIQTRNSPEKVQREALEFAARLAVQHSPSKHSGYVAVDATLKKYVRKPKGAPKGTALYTHERTLHVET